MNRNPSVRKQAGRRWLGLALGAAVTFGYGRCGAGETVSPQVQELIRQVQTGTPQAQVAAADQLVHLGEAARPAVPALLNAMNGKSTWVDVAMMDALSELGSVALPHLLDRFQNGDTDTRLHAARAVWRMGAKAREARPIFQKATGDQDESIRKQALRVVQNLDAELAQDTAASSQGTPATPAIGKTRPANTVSGRTREWPGFRGPDRDGLCAETGLLQEWPATGPKLLWRLDTLGRGHSSLAIAGGRLFTTGDRDVDGQKAQYVLAYDLATRAELWAMRIGAAYPDHGALSTPTVDGEWLYVTSTDGRLCCLDAGTGKLRWQKSLTNDFGGLMMSPWKWSESPLVDGSKVICTPGSTNAMLVALGKQDGALIWKSVPPPLGECGKDGAGYCSAIVAEIDGIRQYIQVVGRGVVGVAADSGQFLWGYNRLASTVANITCPLSRGNEVFIANSYGTGSALLRLSRQGAGFRAAEVYTLPPKVFENHHGGIVLVGDYVYGGSGLNKGDPTCLEFASGRVMWKPKAPVSGSACVLYADGHVIFRYDRGLLLLVEANPAAFRVKGSFTPPRTDSPAWSYPVIHDGRLYVRDQHLLMCYDLLQHGVK